MKLKNLQIQFHGKDHLEHRITYVNENGTQCRDTLCSGEEFAQHVIDCLENAPVLLKERDKAVRSLESAGFTDNGGQLWKPPIGTPPPYLPQEIRYVLHGDIQPCSVLYSDDTTTLLRIDGGDIMCETDTIEWSDSVTYRCQELLKSTHGKPFKIVGASRALAQLVRDERILLNDDAVTGVDELPRPAVVIPKPSPVKPIPSCNNPYVHTNTAYLEEPMRAAGWTTEELVQNGYGHYVPVQHPEAPCVECNSPFDKNAVTCPVCNTIRPTAPTREWTSNNSPTPLR